MRSAISSTFVFIFSRFLEGGQGRLYPVRDNLEDTQGSLPAFRCRSRSSVSRLGLRAAPEPHLRADRAPLQRSEQTDSRVRRTDLHTATSVSIHGAGHNAAPRLTRWCRPARAAGHLPAWSRSRIVQRLPEILSTPHATNSGSSA